MTNRSERIAALVLEAKAKGFAEIDKALAKTSTGTSHLADISRQISEAYHSTGKVVADSYESISRESRRVLKETEQYIEDLDEAAESAQKLNKELKNTGFLSGDLKGKLSTVRTENRAESFATSTISNILPGNLGNASREIFDLLDTIPDLGTAFQVLKASLTDTLAALGGGSIGVGVGVVGAIAVAGVAINALVQAFNAAKEAADKRIESEQQYIEIVQTSTTIEIQEKLKSLKLTQQIQQLQKDNAAEKLAEGMQEVLEAANPLDLSLRALGHAFLDADAASASEAFTKANDALGETNQLVEVYTRALGDQGVVINDAVAAAQAFLNEANALQKLQLDKDIEAQVNAFSASSESIKNNIATMTLERDARQRAIDQQLVSGDVLKEYQNKISELNASIASQGNQLPAVILRELQAAYKEHGEKLIAVDGDLFEKQAAARKTREDALTDAIAKAGDDRSENERKAGMDRSEAQIRANEDSEKEQERHEKALGKIQRDYNAARTSAIQDRDVVALQAAKAARKEQLLDENDANDERKKAISDALEKQNRQIDQSLAEQNRTVDRRLEQQTRTIENRYNDQLNTAQAAAAQAVAIEKKRYDDILTTTQTGSDAILLAWQNLVAQVGGAVNWQGTSTSPSSGTSNTQSARALLNNAPLTPIPATPPQGFNARAGNFGAGQGGTANQIVIPISINGMTQREVVARTKKEVHDRIDYIFKEAGVS